MSFLSKLFGGGTSKSAAAPDPEMHKGFTIFPEPIAAEGRWRLAARIEKDVDGQVKHHHLVRADLLESKDAASAAAVAKARHLIDEQGTSILS